MEGITKLTREFRERFICTGVNRASAACKSDNFDQFFAIFLATKRIALIKEGMPEKLDSYNKIYSWALEKTAKCKVKDDCTAPLAQFAYGVLRDYLDLTSGAPEATYLARATKDYEEEREEARKIQRFYACAHQKIGELDDRLSSAEIIAKAAIASCRSNLQPGNSLNNDDLFNSVGGNLTVSILGNRTKKSKPTNTPSTSKSGN